MLVSSSATISGDMSASITSREIDCSETDKASIHGSWTAGPVGEFQVQVKVNDNDNWTPLSTGIPWEVDGSDSEMMIVLVEMPFKLLRVVWTPTSGSGTLSLFMNEKSVGA